MLSAFELLLNKLKKNYGQRGRSNAMSVKLDLTLPATFYIKTSTVK